MIEILEIVFNMSMIIFVAGSMSTLGLGLNIAQLIAPFKHVKIVAVALFANFVLVPAFALSITLIFPVSEGARIGIILLSLGGGAPFIPNIVAISKAPLNSAAGFMLLLLLVTIFYMPIVVPLVFTDTIINPWNIAKPLIIIMLAPLFFGLLIKKVLPSIAEFIQPLTLIVTRFSVLTLFISMMVLHTKTIWLNINVLPVIILFLLGSMAIGYFAGGKNRNARIILTVGTGLRIPPVAALVASQNFPSEPMAAIIPLLVIIISLVVMLPLAKITSAHPETP